MGNVLRTVSRTFRHRLSGASGDAVEEAVLIVARELLLLLERLSQDLALALHPATSGKIPGLEVLSQEEALGAVSAAAGRIGEAGRGVLQGSLRPYASASTLETLSRVDEKSKGISQAAISSGGRHSSESSRAAEDYAGSYLADVTETMQAAERMVVLEEHDAIGVYELNERPIGMFAAAGAAVVVVLIIALASGG